MRLAIELPTADCRLHFTGLQARKYTLDISIAGSNLNPQRRHFDIKRNDSIHLAGDPLRGPPARWFSALRASIPGPACSAAIAARRSFVTR